ncbi:hypothetical protein ACFLZ5_07975, partial [Thermodesulfobacteriota bacterium]
MEVIFTIKATSRIGILKTKRSKQLNNISKSLFIRKNSLITYSFLQIFSRQFKLYSSALSPQPSALSPQPSAL